jgi:hypothetical protein
MRFDRGRSRQRGSADTRDVIDTPTIASSSARPQGYEGIRGGRGCDLSVAPAVVSTLQTLFLKGDADAGRRRQL